MIRKRSFSRKLTLVTEQVLTALRNNQKQVIVWIAAGIYSLTLVTLFFGSFFRASAFLCKTNRSPSCPDFVLPELEKYRGVLIYFVPTTVLSQRIQDNLPTAKSVSVDKIWPHTLTARVSWLDPIAQVGIPASSSAYLVAESGKIVGAIDEQDQRLPLIIATSAADLIINETITDASVLTAFEAIKYLAGSHSQVTSVAIDGPYAIRLTLHRGTKVLMTSVKPTDIQVRALQLILSQTTMDQRRILIDVRYDKSVIKSD